MTTSTVLRPTDVQLEFKRNGINFYRVHFVNRFTRFPLFVPAKYEYFKANLLSLSRVDVSFYTQLSSC